jgi:hypothetical protein
VHGKRKERQGKAKKRKEVAAVTFKICRYLLLYTCEPVVIGTIRVSETFVYSSSNKSIPPALY